MCGVVGVINFSENKVPENLERKMVARLEHRGPDDVGVWQEKNVYLGHSRLSIHDLSASGHQPMSSFTQRWIIVFNGEIYNFIDIKKKILSEFSVKFYGNSDTEVLINAIELWGIEKTLKQVIGMYAFAAWDRKNMKMYLARDRFGEKPLFYGFQSGIFAFASELKALHPLKELNWQFVVDENVLSSYLSLGYVSEPFSIFKKIFKLKSGCYIEISDSGDQKEYCYWSTIKTALAGKKKPCHFSFEESVDVLQSKLLDSIRLQKSADVPVGAFLSGGVDSSLMVALMQQELGSSIQTFTIGFHEKKYDEAPFAKAVSDHLDSSHTEIYLSQNDLMEIIPDMAKIYDEPFGDSSQIPTYLVSRIAKKEVKVCISGDGGDELFGGYSRYLLSASIWNKFSRCPSYLKSFISTLLGCSPLGLNAFGLNISDKLRKLSLILKHAKTKDILYRHLVSFEQRVPELVKFSSSNSIYKPYNFEDLFENFCYEEWMMLFDTCTYLGNDILTKVDRAGMSVSLETRMPLLDHRIYEFLCLLPIEYKVYNGIGKHILKELLYRYVPKCLIDRPKMGFGIPYNEWLRGGLNQWANDLLDYNLLVKQGFLNPEVVHRYWNEHVSGKRNWSALLWNILAFQAWQEEWYSI